MIIRILGEGQFDVPDSALDELNVLDEVLERAIDNEDQDSFHGALADLLTRVREVGSGLPDDALVASDLVLPYSDATLSEIRDLLNEDGLIPGRSESSTA